MSSTLKGALFSLIASFLQWRQANPRKATIVLILLLAISYRKLKAQFFPKQKKDVRGKVVLITGGASGIGKLTAINLKAKGAIVIIWDINESGLKEMNVAYNMDLCMKCDITSKQKVFQCANDVLRKYTAVDILINNAGIVIGKPILQLKESHIRKTFEVNVIAHFWMLQAFLPAMIDQRSGHIVTIASTASYLGMPYLTDYCASKFAARGLTDSLIHELQDLGLDDGIHTTAIHPYLINTGMFDGATDGKNWFFKKIVGCEMLEPEFVATEIVRAIQYNIRDLVIPDKIARVVSLEHMLPDAFKDWAVTQGPSLKDVHEQMQRRTRH